MIAADNRTPIAAAAQETARPRDVRYRKMVGSFVAQVPQAPEVVDSSACRSTSYERSVRRRRISS
jgi:hypothetical protein